MNDSTSANPVCSVHGIGLSSRILGNVTSYYCPLCPVPLANAGYVHVMGVPPTPPATLTFYNPDTERVKELESRVTALEAERDRLRWAGAQMANICFNLAQRDDLSSATRATLTEVRTKWDAIPRAEGPR